MAKHSIQDLKAELYKIKHATPWDELEAGQIYHIPPLVSLERRDIKILTKDGDSVTYKRVDSTTVDEERKMHKTSVFSRFLVKRKKF